MYFILLPFLFQSTSVVGRERREQERLALPTSDDEPPIQYPNQDTRGAYIDYRWDELNRFFEEVSLIDWHACFSFFILL